MKLDPPGPTEIVILIERTQSRDKIMANKNYTSKAFQNAIFKNFLIKKSIK